MAANHWDVLIHAEVPRIRSEVAHFGQGTRLGIRAEADNAAGIVCHRNRGLRARHTLSAPVSAAARQETGEQERDADARRPLGGE